MTLPAHYLFIFIGAQPRTEWVAGVLERDPKGFILTGPDLLVDGKPPKGWPLRREPYWLEAIVCVPAMDTRASTLSAAS